MRRSLLLFLVALVLSGCGIGAGSAPPGQPDGQLSPTVVATDTAVVATDTAVVATDTAVVATDTAPGTGLADGADCCDPTLVLDRWPAALTAPGPSKMGLHVILNDDPRIMEFIRRVKPRVVKGLDSLDWLAQVKQVSPQTVTLGRFVDVPDRDILDNKEPGQYPNPLDFAHSFIDYFISRSPLAPPIGPPLYGLDPALRTWLYDLDQPAKYILRVF